MNEKDEIKFINEDQKIPFPKLVKKISHYFKGEWGRFIIAMVFVLFQVSASAVIPLISSTITGILKSDSLTEMSLRMIIILAISNLLITVIQQVFHYFSAMFLQKAGQNVVYKLRLEVFEHIENMSNDELNAMPVGALVTRVVSYTSSISDLFTGVLVSLVSNILTVIAVYVVMVIISPTLSLILLGVVLVVFISTLIFRKVARDLFNEHRRTESVMTTFINESLSGMRIIQLFNAENKKRKEFKVRNKDILKANFNIHLAFALYRPFISFLYIGSYALIFFVGLRGELDAASIVAFYLLVSSFFSPVEHIADQFNNLERAMSGTRKLFNLLDTPPTVIDKEDAIEKETFEGKIEFKHVWFAYNEGEWILKDVSFVINPGETIAFVGATGAGKTTILSLIVRNYEIQQGEILIDDINIKDIKIKSLRKAIGQMLQDVFLFSGTIRTNITLYDDESYSDDEINAVARYVNADKFIDKLEHGLDETVIEKGQNFSMGQRQLLSFARTVLARPKIMILDEATANIDTETEKLIQDSLNNMKELGTMLIVAHRLSTIQHCDNIFVLKNGEIIESGNHQALLKKKGLYHKLYQLQFEEN